MSGNGGFYEFPVKFRSKRSIEAEEQLRIDNRQVVYKNVPLKAGKEYAVLVRAHVDQVN